MPSVISSGSAILASDTPPPSAMYYQYWLCTDDGDVNCGRLHKYEGGEWIVMGDDVLTGTFTGVISKIKVVNGRVTEVEVAP